MAMYDPSALYVDPVLSGFSVGWAGQDLYGYRLMPETRTGSKSARYKVFDRSNRVIFPSRREPGSVANEIRGGKWSEDNFQTVQHSLQAAITDEERRNLVGPGGLADPDFGGDLDLDPETDAVDLVMQSLMLEHELKVANLIRNTANYAGNHTVTLAGAAKWSDYTGGVASTSDPVANIRTAIQRIKLDTGRYPNTMLYTFDGVGVIEGHPRVVDRFKAFSLMEPDAWQKLTGLPTPGNIFVADSMYNAADNIDAAENITSFWGQDVWIGLVDAQPGQRTFTFGKTFAMVQPDGSTKPSEKWREESRKSDLVRTTYEYDEKIVSAAAGYLIKNAFAQVT